MKSTQPATTAHNQTQPAEMLQQLDNVVTPESRKASEPAADPDNVTQESGQSAGTTNGSRKTAHAHETNAQKPHRRTKRHEPEQIPANDTKRHTARNYKAPDKRRTKGARNHEKQHFFIDFIVKRVKFIIYTYFLTGFFRRHPIGAGGIKNLLQYFEKFFQKFFIESRTENKFT